MTSIGFACCVESGYLESQTVRLVESLRRWGGKFANAPIIAVTPRFGPPLSRTTLSLFDKHQVTYVRTPSAPQYAWFNFYNKPLAMLVAEQHTQTDTLGFLDSDLLVVQEPVDLELRPGEDFTAFPVETKEMGTKGPGDPFEGLWQATCDVAGVQLESLPWITTAQTHKRVRMYFNGGLFVYRRGSGFAQEYMRLCRALLDSKISTHARHYGLGFKEMVSAAMAVMTLKLNWRPLSYSYNYVMASTANEGWYSLDALKQARIVHYHDAMWPAAWDTFLGRMRDAHPDVAAWLASVGPMANNAPLLSRALGKYLRDSRKRQQSRYLASCTEFF